MPSLTALLSSFAQLSKVKPEANIYNPNMMM
jgi:hypothetical protein